MVETPVLKSFCGYYFTLSVSFGCFLFSELLFVTGKAQFLLKLNSLYDKMPETTVGSQRVHTDPCNMYILLDVLLCSIAEYCYELGVKILSDTTQQNVF